MVLGFLKMIPLRIRVSYQGNIKVNFKIWLKLYKTLYQHNNTYSLYNSSYFCLKSACWKPLSFLIGTGSHDYSQSPFFDSLCNTESMFINKPCLWSFASPSTSLSSIHQHPSYSVGNLGVFPTDSLVINTEWQEALPLS